MDGYVTYVWTRRENVMPKFKEFAEKNYTVPMAKREKHRKMNPKTNRMKNFKKVRQLVTEIPPEERSFKNIPKYSTGKSKVTPQAWLEIEQEKRKPDHTANSFGKAANGKWYGWSHRAMYGFKAGDEVKGDSLGKKVEYPKYTQSDVDAAKSTSAKSDKVVVIPTLDEPNYDKPSYEADFTVKDDAHAREIAITFAENVS